MSLGALCGGLARRKPTMHCTTPHATRGESCLPGGAQAAWPAWLVVNVSAYKQELLKSTTCWSESWDQCGRRGSDLYAKRNDDECQRESRARERSLDPLSKVRALKAKIYDGAPRGFSDFPRTIITRTSRFILDLATARAAKQTMTGTGRVSGTA